MIDKIMKEIDNKAYYYEDYCYGGEMVANLQDIRPILEKYLESATTISEESTPKQEEAVDTVKRCTHQSDLRTGRCINCNDIV